jgi:hypothetical protein
MFAIHYKPDNSVDWVGEVFSDTHDRLRIQVVSALMLTGCGLWQLTDEIVEVPKSECRIFLTEQSAAEACFRANGRLKA